MPVESDAFGRTHDGAAVRVHTLRSAGSPLVARVCDRGATLVALDAPDRDGRRASVVLGCDDVAGYEAHDRDWLGCVVGRVANRIGGAAFVVDGQRWAVAPNEGPNVLHGGATGLGRRVWRAEVVGDAAVRFTVTSPDGDGGWPGTVTASATYALDGDALRLQLDAVADRPTPVDLTHHAYWNLAGAGDVLDHELAVPADRWVPVDDAQIPTGVLAPVDRTPLDLRGGPRLGDVVPRLDAPPASGLDHCLVVTDPTAPPVLRETARLRHPASGRTLVLATTQPALQVYSGNHLRAPWPRHGGLCLEPQRPPDAVHHPGFGDVVLRPGARFAATVVWRLGVG